MNKDEMLGYAKKAVPWIAAAATGNVPALITMAANAVGDALGVDIEPTAVAVASAVAGATPEQLAAIRMAEKNFELEMRRMEYTQLSELNAGAYADTASARARDVELIKITGKSNRRADIMLGLTYLGLAALVTCMLVRDIDANSALGGIVVLLIGKLISQWETGFQFEFGTTRGSKTKDDTIKSLSGQ